MEYFQSIVHFPPHFGIIFTGEYQAAYAENSSLTHLVFFGALFLCGTAHPCLFRAQEPSCQPQAVRALIKSHVDNSDLLSSVGTELSFRLPINASAHFPAMLRQLDAQVLCAAAVCERGSSLQSIIQNEQLIINNRVGV